MRDSLANDKPLRWSPVFSVPDYYIYFDHSIHIAKGIGCSSCHGRIDDMRLTTARMQTVGDHGRDEQNKKYAAADQIAALLVVVDVKGSTLPFKCLLSNPDAPVSGGAIGCAINGAVATVPLSPTAGNGRSIVNRFLTTR